MVDKNKTKMDRESWALAALTALAEGGIAAVKVEVLARKLEVTKGSFYWHFKNRTELLHAMLEYWRNLGTEQVIEAVNEGAQTPADRLRRLVKICTKGEADRIEAAIRAWALHDQVAGQVVAEVDQQREAFVQALLEAHGLAPEEAAARTRIFYLALIGEFTWVAHGKEASPRQVWKTLSILLLRP